MKRVDEKRSRWYEARVSRWAVLALLLWGAWGSGMAHAYEEQATLGVEAGYAASGETALPVHGASLGLSGSLGLSDMWSLRARLAYAWHPGEGAAHVGVGGAEIVYLLDILQVVPFFGLGVDAFGVVQHGDLGVDPAAHAILGFDYLLGWDWLLGVEVRPVFRVAGLEELQLYVMANARLSFVFDLY